MSSKNSTNPVEQVAPSGLEKTKRKLHEQLARIYLLPSIKSRACHCTYLCKVKEKSVFLVEKKALLKREADYADDFPLRAPGLTVLAMTRRIDKLLGLLGKPSLGFTSNALPDEGYLIRLARYVDPSNLLEIFLAPAPRAKGYSLKAEAT